MRLIRSLLHTTCQTDYFFATLNMQVAMFIFFKTHPGNVLKRAFVLHSRLIFQPVKTPPDPSQASASFVSQRHLRIILYIYRSFQLSIEEGFLKFNVPICSSPLDLQAEY